MNCYHKEMQKHFCPCNCRMKKMNLFLLFIIFFTCISACKKEFKNIDTNENSNSGKFLSRNFKPNIILIIVDDMGYEIPTFTGGQSYNTPNLDFIASKGIQFTQAYCHPDGFPSRLASFTGKYNFRNYINWGILPMGEKTIGNMLQDAGYATCFVGKWQNDGGDLRIRAAGFEKYLVYLPYSTAVELDLSRRYKNPLLYENSHYLQDSITNGKYSEDLNVEYLDNFIDSNLTNPFFAVYSMALVQRPWSPTPDDPEFTNWDPSANLEDIKFFPSMVNYMDKKIGEILNHLKENGIRGNTLVIVTTDNGTNVKIHSMYNGVNRKGAKNATTLWGIRIPLIAMWPAKIQPGQTSNTLIDFTDFLRTFADVADVPVPTNYGILDGVSFYDNLRNIPGTDRSWSFCQWDNNPTDNKPVIRYINDTMYKLYDTPLYDSFYNVKNDYKEKNKLKIDSLSVQEINLRDSFIAVLQSMHN